MWAALRSRRTLSLSSFASSRNAATIYQWNIRFPGLNRSICSSMVESNNFNSKSTNGGLLNLQEVEKILSDVRADDVQVFPVKKHSEFADFVVVATGRSPWHVRNIAQALIYQVKQKQIGAKRMLLPSVEGQEGGKWIVIDSGSLVVHALDEKARAYYNLERLWTTEVPNKEPSQDLEKAFVKVRRKNNSKKPAKTST